MASSPPRCIRFELDWLEPFDYPAGPLDGQGPWDASTTDVIASGMVQQTDLGGGAATAEDVLDAMNKTAPWRFDVVLEFGASPGVLTSIACYVGGNFPAQVGWQLDVGSDLGDGEFSFVGLATPAPATVGLPSTGFHTVSIVYNGINVVFLWDGVPLNAPFACNPGTMPNTYPTILFGAAADFDGPTIHEMHFNQ